MSNFIFTNVGDNMMFEEFQDPINNILKNMEIETSIKLMKPPSSDLGEFCINVNQFARKTYPIDLSNDLLPELQKIKGIEQVSISTLGNPKKPIVFLNFKLETKVKLQILSSKLEDVLTKVHTPTYAYLDTNKGKPIIVEHTSANPISPIHVGNLRNSILGDTYARILSRSGHDVFIHYYVNDVGLQIGFVVVGYEIAVHQLSMEPDLKIDLWTGQIYAIMNCFYTIQKLKQSSVNRGVNIDINYQITDDEKDLMLDSLDTEVSTLIFKNPKVEDMEKLSPSEKQEIKKNKLQIKKLKEEINDIINYQDVFRDLKSRFPELFNALFNNVSEIDLQAKVADYLYKYEHNLDESITKLFREVVDLVLRAFEKTLLTYNIEFDSFDYESDVTWSGLPNKLIDQLAKHENAQVDGQSVRYTYPKASMDNFINNSTLNKSSLPIKGQISDLQLRRSDGTALYAAKDIAYSIQKFEKRTPYKIFNVISTEQTLPQYQMLLPLYELGYEEYASNLHHFAYENVDLLGAVMSGRLAKYITADDYYKESFKRAKSAKEKADKERGVPPASTEEEEELEYESIQAVTLASTRFPLIETSPTKRIELDINRELDFKRNSGPFVQYAHARCNSLIDRVTTQKKITINKNVDFELISDSFIIEIILHLEDIENQIMLAVNDRDPSKIASWVFQLAQYFMKFYENYSVMNAETTELLQARLLVVSAIKIGIANGLDMLGLPAASKL